MQGYYIRVIDEHGVVCGSDLLFIVHLFLPLSLSRSFCWEQSRYAAAERARRARNCILKSGDKSL